MLYRRLLFCQACMYEKDMDLYSSHVPHLNAADVKLVIKGNIVTVCKGL